MQSTPPCSKIKDKKDIQEAAAGSRPQSKDSSDLSQDETVRDIDLQSYIVSTIQQNLQMLNKIGGISFNTMTRMLDMLPKSSSVKGSKNERRGGYMSLAELQKSLPGPQPPVIHALESSHIYLKNQRDNDENSINKNHQVSPSPRRQGHNRASKLDRQGAIKKSSSPAASTRRDFMDQLLPLTKAKSETPKKQSTDMDSIFPELPSEADILSRSENGFSIKLPSADDTDGSEKPGPVKDRSNNTSLMQTNLRHYFAREGIIPSRVDSLQSSLTSVTNSNGTAATGGGSSPKPKAPPHPYSVVNKKLSPLVLSDASYPDLLPTYASPLTPHISLDQDNNGQDDDEQQKTFRPPRPPYARPDLDSVVEIMPGSAKPRGYLGLGIGQQLPISPAISTRSVSLSSTATIRCSISSSSIDSINNEILNRTPSITDSNTSNSSHFEFSASRDASVSGSCGNGTSKMFTPQSSLASITEDGTSSNIHRSPAKIVASGERSMHQQLACQNETGNAKTHTPSSSPEYPPKSRSGSMAQDYSPSSKANQLTPASTPPFGPYYPRMRSSTHNDLGSVYTKPPLPPPAHQQGRSRSHKPSDNLPKTSVASTIHHHKPRPLPTLPQRDHHQGNTDSIVYYNSGSKSHPALFKSSPKHASASSSGVQQQRSNRDPSPLSYSVGSFDLTANIPKSQHSQNNGQHQQQSNFVNKSSLISTSGGIDDAAAAPPITDPTNLPSLDTAELPFVAKVMYDYEAQVPTDISFKKGDSILVLGRLNNDWWLGSVLDQELEENEKSNSSNNDLQQPKNKKGTFPKSFICI
ncbi:hypothetical protein H4219_003694 [Mycoemilia scoparia]|uniref:SH3 domain-containing protein n=1 Tax=Mycoemilia scoparia TaxID=417184 RepID=A0A9W8A239_9FUNG|nr:hypothetical protein H4219_003694 [Mycoemilia scoparia]